jgi:hypothetical protein
MSVQKIKTSDFGEFARGELVVLISWFDDSIPRQENFKISKLVPRTNSSNELRINGWLGSADNINKSAHGLHRAISVEPIVEDVTIGGITLPERVGDLVQIEKIMDEKLIHDFIQLNEKFKFDDYHIHYREFVKIGALINA